MEEYKPFQPSQTYLAQKLSTKKALKRKPKRQFKVLTDKLTREHVRKLYMNNFNKIKDLLS